jgi:hypothetical protein
VVGVDGRAVASAGLWFQQNRSNKSEREEKRALLEELKQMKGQLEIAGRQLVQSDRQHDETRKDLESAISDLKLEIRHIHGDWSDFKKEDLFQKEEVWEVMAESDAKLGGRREMPKLKGEWEERLDRLRAEQGNEREKGMLHFI